MNEAPQRSTTTSPSALSASSKTGCSEGAVLTSTSPRTSMTRRPSWASVVTEKPEPSISAGTSVSGLEDGVALRVDLACVPVGRQVGHGDRGGAAEDGPGVEDQPLPARADLHHAPVQGAAAHQTHQHLRGRTAHLTEHS